jgi:hypothetical protein
MEFFTGFTLKSRNMVAQNGARHAWRNRGTKPATIALFLNGAKASRRPFGSRPFNAPTIRSSLNRLFLIGASPLVVLYPEKLSYGGTSFRGAGHSRSKEPEDTDNEVRDASDDFERRTWFPKSLAGPNDRHIAGPSRVFARFGSSVAR